MQEAINENILGQGYSYDQLQHIVVVMEDSGYAFNYIKYILKHTFPYLQIYMVQSCEFRGLLNTVKYVIDNKNQDKFNGYIDYCMIIYDAGNADFTSMAVANNALKQQKYMQTLANSSFSHCGIVQYQCFEECILQIQDLGQIIHLDTNSDLYREYSRLMSGESDSIDFDKYRTENKSDEQLIEDQVQIITDAQTKYAIRHTSGYFGSCWKRECNKAEDYRNCSDRSCNIQFDNKRKYVIGHQLLYIIIHMIEMHIGHKINNNKQMNDLIMQNRYIRQLWEDSVNG